MTNKTTLAGDVQLLKMFRLDVGQQELITESKCSKSSLILTNVKSVDWGQGWFHANSEIGTKAGVSGGKGLCR